MNETLKDFASNSKEFEDKLSNQLANQSDSIAQKFLDTLMRVKGFNH